MTSKTSFCNFIRCIVSCQCSFHAHYMRSNISSKHENVIRSSFSSKCNILFTKWLQRETLQSTYVCICRAGKNQKLDSIYRFFQSYDVENYIFHLSRLGLNGLDDDEDTVQMIIESKSVNMGLPMVFECSYDRLLVYSETSLIKNSKLKNLLKIQ